MPPRKAPVRGTKTVDDLADQLATGLAISKPAKKPTVDKKLEAMRAVNFASQGLSALVQSGWKVSDISNRKNMATAKSHAETAAKNVQVLRTLAPKDLDIERAAVSVVGKLVSLEMFDSAEAALLAMRPHIATLYSQAAPTSKDVLKLLDIPTETPSDPVVLTLISTYLLHSVTIMARTPKIGVLADALPRFLQWVPLLSDIPAKHRDSVLTRVYSVLAKCTSPKLHAECFRVKLCALECLLHTSPGTVDSNTFWDQTSKFAAVYVKAASGEDEIATKTVLEGFSMLVTLGETRGDSYTQGKGFVAFCEYWMMFANRTRDLGTLDRLADLLQSSPSSSGKQSAEKEVARICATIAQAMALLEQLHAGTTPVDSEDMERRILEVIKVIRRSIQVPQSDKIDRNIERLRRLAGKLLESYSEMRLLLDGVVEAMSARIAADSLSSVLDTLFNLARTTLNTAVVETFDPAYAYLQKAATLAEQTPSTDKANLVRCVSGAFHNLAGTLYQSGRYAYTVRFLRQGCSLGTGAMGLHGADDGQEDGWKQLAEQLYRRWELLGVCHSKIGDRRAAYDSFVECVKTFPYEDTAFEQSANTTGPSSLFGSFKQLASIVDRMTYMGACHLLLPAAEISLAGCVKSPIVVGALLERQLESLDESMWKEGVRDTVEVILGDVLKVYDPRTFPVRRARMLLRYLEFAYQEPPETHQGASPLEMGEEADAMLRQDDLGQDTDLGRHIPQYRASVSLWLALHAHRSLDPEQGARVAQYAREGCKALRPLVYSAPRESLVRIAKTASPKAIIPPKSRARATPARRAAAPPPAPTKPRAATRAAATRNPVTPRAPKVVQVIRVVKSPRVSLDGSKSTLPSADVEKILGLMEMTSQLLGLLGLVLPKINLLDLMRRLSESHPVDLDDAHISASVDLAHEYLKLGKTRKASTIYGQALAAVRNGRGSEEVRTRFLLRYAESLASVDNISRGSGVYCEALTLADLLAPEDKNMSTSQRVRIRVGRLERAATASHVFATIQYSREDVTASLEGLMQSLRLWNRAVDALSRLRPAPVAPQSAVVESNPFQMSSPVKDPVRANGPEASTSDPPVPPKLFSNRSSMDGLDWRVADGLLTTMFALSQAYFTRGSAREAEYFAQQAQDLAESLNAPAMISRALARKGEVQLYEGHLAEGYETLMRAAALLEDLPGADAADVHRLLGDYSQRSAQNKDAEQLYAEATVMLEDLEKTFALPESISAGPRKSTGLSPKPATVSETLVPALLANVLRQHIWLLRDVSSEDVSGLLKRLFALPPSGQTKAVENAIMGKLSLHEVYGRFRGDMFLSSLAESTITIPMGMSGDKLLALSTSTQDILTSLDTAEKFFWAELALIARRGAVANVRDAAVSLALIRALQTSLGRVGSHGPLMAASLLDASAAITLRREMLETIQNKFPDASTQDDLQWPLVAADGAPLPKPKNKLATRFRASGSDEDEDASDSTPSLKDYWKFIEDKYRLHSVDPSSLARSRTALLSPSWTVINISVTEDKSTMFVTRQRGKEEPLIFCLPLRGRRESEDDEHLSFEDALGELKDIIKLSDEGTRSAVNVKSNDVAARTAWWGDRAALDKRMQELLENIEFCWLGAFKTILSPPMTIPADIVIDLRARFDQVFKRSLRAQDRKQKTKIKLDDNLLECFSTLSPKCRDEELEDLVYFILDLYQFHGVPVAIAEVDVDQVVVDLRAALEEHASATKAHRGVIRLEDEHVFLVLDKNVQGIPWESIPILRGRSVSRVPSTEFLVDRVQLARWSKGISMEDESDECLLDRVEVDPRKGYYVLNPSGDLKNTEARLTGWVEDMSKSGWDGVVGRPPSEQQLLDAFSKRDLVVYFGHGGGEQYIRSHKIRNLAHCAATMLWGCSSGALREMGDFDRVGTPYNYMLAGCPTLVANLWDVTDRDIDKFSQSVFSKLRLTPSDVKKWRPGKEGKTSVVEAVAQSRASCKLKYLTGAAPVIYGIPFYL